MAKLYSAQTQQIVDVPDDRVQEAYLSGRFAFPKGAKVPVLDPDGQPGYMPESSIARAFQSGYTYEPKIVGDAQLQADYGGPVEQAKAGAEAVASGATLGFSRMVERGLGVKPEAMAARKAANPITSTAGEIGGAILGTMLVPEASIPARAGMAAERTIAGLVPQGISATAKAIAATAPKLAGSAVEGALYNLGNVVDEAALHQDMKPQLTAEHLLASIGVGALIGAGASAGGQIIKAGVKQIPVPTNMLPKGLGPDALEEYAGQKATEAFTIAGNRKKGQLLADMQQGGGPELGNILMDRKVLTPGAKLETMVERADAQLKQVGPEIEGYLKALDKVAKEPAAGLSGAGEALNAELGVSTAESLSPRAKAIFGKVESQVIQPLRKMGLGTADAMADKVEKEIAPFLEKFGDGPVSLEALHRWRANFDKLKGAWGRSETPIIQEMRAVRGIVEDEIENSVNAIAKQAAPEFVGKYEQAKRVYGALRWASDVGQDAQLALQANNKIGLRDIIAASGGIANGSILTGAILGAGSKYMRERGASVVAVAAARLAQVERAVQANQGRLVNAITGIIGAGGRAAAAAPVPAAVHLFREANQKPYDAYEKRWGELQKIQQNPAVLVERMGNASEQMNVTAPITSQLMQAKAAEIVSYLIDKAPKNPNGTDNTLLQRAWKPSDQQIDAWGRAWDAAQDPVGVLEEMRHGRLSTEGLEVLQTLYPELYGEVQKQITDAMVKAQVKDAPPLPFPVKQQLSRLTGIPMDGTLQPDFIKFMQGLHQAQPDQDAAEKPANKVQLQAPQILMSGMEQIANRRAGG